ncbi:hypothetical protein [Candidatus Magnetomonas plexicatena]|uniref:hypothetical protein n=1 Tax=Candidatus Magnetomonas plexicatena TaxID=2552947 RepID=UPI001C78DE83|nr:hypothetical protein E2O03_000495 [Nitrospirales bacterium LBB_01]
MGSTISSLTPDSPMIFYKGTETDYMELVKVTTTAIKKVYPQAQILNGGATGGNTSYWQDVLDLTGASPFDVGNWHYLPQHDDVGDLATSLWHDIFSHKNVNRLWNTEYMVFSTNHPDTGANNSPDEHSQAKNIVKGYVKAFADGAEKIFYVYYKMSDAGLIDPQGDRKKKAYYTLKKLIKKIDSFTSVTTAPAFQDNSTYAYKFEVAGKPVYVVWANTGKTITFPLSSTSVTGALVTQSTPADESGNFTVSYYSVTNGSFDLYVSDVPCYIEEISGN